MFFGCKTQAWFDLWSIEHIITGICLGQLVALFRGKIFPLETGKIRFDFLCILCIALGWENLEHYLETGVAGDGVTYWFQGVEFWGNRLLADPACVVIGWLIYVKKPQLHIFSRMFSIIWLGLHVFIFPHSMYLHTQYLHQCATIPFHHTQPNNAGE